MRRIVLVVLLGLAAAVAGRPATAADALQVVYPTIGGEETRNAYPLAVLRLALAESGEPHALSLDAAPRSQARVINDLEHGHDITVAWMGTSIELETRLLPVRIPIWRGLLGYRLMLIDRARQPEFSAVRSLTDLARFRMGQGLGWTDVRILDNAGMTVVTAPYDALFAMLAGGRFDAFPRGAGEAFPELRNVTGAYPALTVESDLLLVYRFDQFFFTGRDNPALAAAIQRGLEAAYRDGRFLALFASHPAVAEIFTGADLPHRRRFDIPNPLLSPETAALPAQYWYRPGDS